MTMTDQDNRLLEALQAFVAAPAPADAPAIPDAVAAQARELDDLRTAIKVLKEREETLRASLLDFMSVEGVDSVTDGVVSINLSSHERAGVDRKRMEALYPKVLADCETKTTVVQVRVKVKG
jgi:hypothetical protein